MRVNNELIEYAPYIVTTAGFMAGIAIDRVAGQRGDSKRHAADHAHGVSDEELQERLGYRQGVDATEANTQNQPYKPSVLERVRKNPRLPIAIGLTTGLATYAWAPAPAPESSVGVAGMVIDHSYETALDGTTKRINTLAEELESTGELKLRALVAHDSGYDPIKISRLTEDRPFGAPSVDQALSASMSEAFDSSQVTDSSQLDSGKKRYAGVVVITNGNTVGNASAVIKQAEERGDLPVFIANVGSNTGKTAKDLKQVADRTEGQYWHVSPEAEETAQEMAKTIKPQEITEKAPQDSKLPVKLFSLLSAVLTVSLLRARAELYFKGRRKDSN